MCGRCRFPEATRTSTSRHRRTRTSRGPNTRAYVLRTLAIRSSARSCVGRIGGPRSRDRRTDLPLQGKISGILLFEQDFQSQHGGTKPRSSAPPEPTSWPHRRPRQQKNARECKSSRCSSSCIHVRSSADAPSARSRRLWGHTPIHVNLCGAWRLETPPQLLRVSVTPC